MMARVTASSSGGEDSYHSTRTSKKFYGHNGRIEGSVRMQIKVSLHNHSPDVYAIYRASEPVRLLYNLRVRHDKFGPDETVFSYPGEDGCYAPVKTCSNHSPWTGSGHRKLPFESKQRYFLDAYSFDLRANGRRYTNLPGSFQSDRAICFKTKPCKFYKKDLL